MAEGNGEIIEEMATAVKTAEPTVETERTSDYPKLVEYGLDKRVCSRRHIFRNFISFSMQHTNSEFCIKRWPVN